MKKKVVFFFIVFWGEMSTYFGVFLQQVSWSSDRTPQTQFCFWRLASDDHLPAGCGGQRSRPTAGSPPRPRRAGSPGRAGGDETSWLADAAAPCPPVRGGEAKRRRRRRRINSVKVTGSKLKSVNQIMVQQEEAALSQHYKETGGEWRP